MNGQKIMTRALVSLLKVFSCIAIFSLVGFLSYKLTMNFYQEAKQYTSASEVSVMNTVSEASLDSVSVNAIFSVEEDSAEITNIILEIFNTQTKNIDLITIPATLHMEMSSELYEEIRKTNENIPQIVELGTLGEYFKQDIVYEYAIVLLEKLLDMNISFYTTMKQSSFEEYFERYSKEEERYQFKDKIITKLQELKTDTEFATAMGEYYNEIQSNLTQQKRRQLVKYYLNANYTYIYTYALVGEWENSEFKVTEDSRQQVEQIIDNEQVHQSAQVEGEDDFLGEQGHVSDNEDDILSSKGYRIQILNGSMVTGLGATYKQRLVTAGYSIASVGNYMDEILDTTRIYVSENGLGRDLEEYFKEPILETKSALGGYDIIIVLGKNDAN